MLKASDLPIGWESAPPSADSSSNDKKLADCVGVDPSVFGSNHETSADSDDFSMNNGDTTISNTVSCSKDATVAAQAFAVVQGDKMAPCVNKLLTDELQGKSSNGATVTNITTHTVNFPPYLDRSVAYRSTFTIQYKGLSPAAYADYVFAQKGRATAGFTFIDVLLPFDTTLEQQVIKTVTDRVAALQQ